MHCSQASCGCLFMKTAWPMLFPPGAVPGEIEGQELTVLGTKERDKLGSEGSGLYQPQSGAGKDEGGQSPLPIPLRLQLCGTGTSVPICFSMGKPDFHGFSPHTTSSRNIPCLGRQTLGHTIMVSRFLKALSFTSLAKLPQWALGLRSVTGITSVSASSVHHTTT